jgi:hypothetical protein
MSDWADDMAKELDINRWDPEMVAVYLRNHCRPLGSLAILALAQIEEEGRALEARRPKKIRFMTTEEIVVPFGEEEEDE